MGARAIPAVNADGTVRDWFGVTFDISGRKAAESLAPEGAGTRLVFSSIVPDGDPEHFAGGLAGWHWHLDALPVALDGGRKPTSMDEWEQQRQRYLALITS